MAEWAEAMAAARARSATAKRSVWVEAAVWAVAAAWSYWIYRRLGAPRWAAVGFTDLALRHEMERRRRGAA